MQNGPSSSSSTARKPEKSASAQSRCSASIRRAAFFPPGLDPVLDRGVGDKHAVVAPEGPFGGPIREAVLDDQPDGEVDDPAGVMAAGVSPVGHIGVEVLAAAGAVVLGIEHHDIARPPGEGVSQVVEGAATPPIAEGAVAAVRAGAPPVDPAPDADLGLGQILGTFDPHGGIGAIFARSWHGEAPGRRVLPGITSEDGKVFTDSARFSCYRLNDSYISAASSQHPGGCHF